MNAARNNELPHRLRESANQRTNHECENRNLKQSTSTVEVGEFSKEWSSGCAGEHVRGADPGVVLESAKVANNGGECGVDNGAIERRQSQAGHHAGEDHIDLSLGEISCVEFGGASCGRFGRHSFLAYLYGTTKHCAGSYLDVMGFCHGVTR